MKTERNIFVAFILNLIFSIFEFIGGIITGSVAIISDAIHDTGDAISVGISYFLEKKSKRQPDEKYTYGYARYSVIGGVITTLILIVGSIIVIFNAINKIINPSPINYNGMIFLAIIGVVVNFFAAYFTREGDSINQKAVNLHMLEDVLGWIVVLIGAIVMNFTDFAIVDPIMSIGIAIFILSNAIKNLKNVVYLFLEKIPHGMSVEDIREQVLEINGILDVHHIHIWSMDGQSNYATMHVVTNEDYHETKEKVREKLKEYGIGHATLELEAETEHCCEHTCTVHTESNGVHYHHHH